MPAGYSVSVLCTLLLWVMSGLCAVQITSCNSSPYVEDQVEYTFDRLPFTAVSDGAPCLTFTGNNIKITNPNFNVNDAGRTAMLVTGVNVTVDGGYVQGAIIFKGDNVHVTGTLTVTNVKASSSDPCISVLFDGTDNAQAENIVINTMTGLNIVGVKVQNASGVVINLSTPSLTNDIIETATTLLISNVSASKFTYKDYSVIDVDTADEVVDIRIEYSNNIEIEQKTKLAAPNVKAIEIDNCQSVTVKTQFSADPGQYNTPSGACIGILVVESNNTKIMPSTLNFDNCQSSSIGIHLKDSTLTRIEGADITNNPTVDILTTGILSESSTFELTASTLDLGSAPGSTVNAIQATNSNVSIFNSTIKSSRTGLNFDASTQFIFAVDVFAATKVNSNAFSDACGGNGANAGVSLCYPPSSFDCCSELCDTATTKTCRNSTGLCDQEEKCSGDLSCPVDKYWDAQHVCNSTVLPCGGQTFCTGNNITCNVQVPCSGFAEVCGSDNTACVCSHPEFDYPDCGLGCNCPADTICNNINGTCAPCSVAGQCACAKPGYAFPYCNTCQPGTCTSGTCNTVTGLCECSIHPEAKYPECTCGDGTCAAGENVYNCPEDCCEDRRIDCYPTNNGSAPCCSETCRFAPTSLSCNSSMGFCEQASYCSGNSTVCPPKTYKTGVCRSSIAPCDAPEFCTGNSVACPADVVQPNTYVCNRTTTSCNQLESKCDGTNMCPPIVPVPCPSFCSDGVCDPDETCQSCYMDCSHTCVRKCPGTPECSNHGDCRNGVCFCQEGFTGPRCSDVSIPVVIVHNTTTTTIVVPTPGNNSTGEQLVSFKVGISRIFEIKPTTKEVVAEYSLADRSFNATYENMTSSERWNTTINFPNGATLKYSTWIFYQAQTISFANLDIPVNNYTVKNIVDLRNWGFAAFTNQLVIEYDMTLDGAQQDDCTPSSIQQDAQNVYYFTLTTGSGVSLYCQLVDAIVVDDQIKIAQFKVNDTNKLQVIVPHFWESLLVDPNFSVLLGEDDESDFNTHNDCSTKQTETKGKGFNPVLVAIIVAPIVGAIILVLLFVTVIYPRLSTWYQLKKGAQHMMEIDEVPQHEPVIEHNVADMEIYTAAGRFTVKY